MKQKQVILFLFATIIIIFLGFFLFRGLFESSKSQAEEAIDTFYQHEQEGSFSLSWEMFHPLMKEKFQKGHYLQDRAHVFMNHFGVSTFEYSRDSIDKVEKWEMEEGSEVISEAYVAKIYQTFKGKYGNFTIEQEVYTTEVDGEWLILWNYNK